MKSKLVYILIGALVLGGILFGVGMLLPGNTPSTAGVASRNALEPFTSIDLSVKSADVSIVYGDDYAVSYDLHGREPVETLEVRNGTLMFDTGFSARWKPTSGDWSVVVTVPAGTTFDSVSLHTTAGDIELRDLTAADLDLKSTSGDIELENVTAETLIAETVSDDIELDGCVLTDSAHLKSVSGDISANGDFGVVKAESIGGVTLNGASQGRKMAIGKGSPTLTAESISGEINLILP